MPSMEGGGVEKNLILIANYISKYKKKVCLITGSSSGIGESIARSFEKEGAKVIITYNSNRKDASKVAASLKTDFFQFLRNLQF